MIAPAASATLTVAVAIVVGATASALPASASVATAAPTATTACVATVGSFSWGFKESFRAYVSGSIANGEWSTEGGITYDTPSFSSDSLTGDVALATMVGELAVEGSMRFTGHEGILDTTIADPRMRFDGVDRLVVVVDVTGTTQDFVEVNAPEVAFVTGDLSAAEWRVDGDALVIEQIALTLTAEGAEAFGTYPEGEPFDALSITLTTTDSCATDALAARASAQQGPWVIALIALIAVSALAVAALAVVWALRRRRVHRESERPDLRE